MGRTAGMKAIGIGNRRILVNADLIYEQTKDIKLEDIEKIQAFKMVL